MFYIQFELPGLGTIRCAKLTSVDFTFIISSPNPMVDLLVDSSYPGNFKKWTDNRDASKKSPNIDFVE